MTLTVHAPKNPHPFGVGDVVRLRSGGHHMLVVDLLPAHIVAAWPVDGVPREEKFIPETLALVARGGKA